jgi:hypothetical protein
MALLPEKRFLFSPHKKGYRGLEEVHGYKK